MQNGAPVDDPALPLDATRFSWNRNARQDAQKGKHYKVDRDGFQLACYRPFFKQRAYFAQDMNAMLYQLKRLFPTPNHENAVICVSGLGGAKTNSVLIADILVDLNCLDAGTQCFPLYYYDKNEHVQQANLFDTDEDYIRRDGISDFILARVRELCGPKVTKKDIFYYVYGILHSPQYRAKYAVNLKKTLPRLPMPEDPKTFWAFSKAGVELAELHLNYESLPPHKAIKEDSSKNKPSTRVQKMRFAKRGKEEDKSAIIYNDDITLWNIPLDAYDYVVNGKSAIEWVMERYQVTTHKESGIVNDPNLWCDEHGNPRYIIDLIKRLATLSLETRRIVNSLPTLEL